MACASISLFFAVEIADIGVASLDQCVGGQIENHCSMSNGIGLLGMSPWLHSITRSESSTYCESDGIFLLIYCFGSYLHQHKYDNTHMDLPPAIYVGGSPHW